MPDPDGPSQPDIRPNRVRYNDWRQLDVPTPDAFAPTLPVSVIVPCCDMPEELGKTLAALERQTWPRHLFEVIVVDDGSEPPLEPPASPLDVRIVRREGSGFSLAAARNAGAAAAAHSILVFLDCDVLPEAEFLAAHARWHHVVSDALTLSCCGYVDVDDDPAAIRRRTGSLEELFAGREFDSPWTLKYFRRSRGMTRPGDSVFPAIAGIFGIGRAFFDTIGGFDETFVRYGCEDSEFGYRAFTRGALIVPQGQTLSWHQGRWPNRPPDELRDIELQRVKISHLVPHSLYRSPAPGRIFTVPRHAVTIHAGDKPRHVIAEDVETLLAGSDDDLTVRIELAAERRDHRTLWLQEQFGPDPRVSIAAGDTALDDFPHAAFHVSVPAGACGRGLVQRLRDGLGVGVTARMAVPGAGANACVATITRTWALHRSRRTGLPVEHFGDVVTIFPDDDTSSAKAGEGAPGAFRRALREARTVRGPRSAARFLEWLTSRLLNRLQRALRFPARRRAGRER